jgi:IclR family transcriptional regulator, acetate operon repressor
VFEDADSRAEPTISAVLRAADVLFCVAESAEPNIGVTEVADKVGVSKAVVYRLLSSLRAKGLVDMDEETHRYSLGPRVLALGEAYRARVDLRSICRAEMADLVGRTDETATLSLRHGCKRTYIDQIVPSRDVKMVVQIGQEYPLHAGASSKAFLAFLPPEEQRDCMTELARLTDHTMTSRRTLQRELAGIRERGYAVSLGERDPSAGSVAAPIFAADSPVPVAVMSVCGPVERFSTAMEAIPGLLCAATRRVSARLGHVTRP